MTEIQTTQRRVALAKSGGICEVCGKPLNGIMQGAHRIANTNANRAKFGSWILDNPLNIAIVCSLKCNDACNIGNNPGAVFHLIRKMVDVELRRFK